MLGIILTGHGKFATGLQSSVELIAGKQEKFAAVDFEKGESSNLLTNKLKTTISNMIDDEGIIIFTDIPGGTPFTQSVLLSQEDQRIKVITGVNLPAIMDGIFNRTLDTDAFIEKVLQSGKNNLMLYLEKEKESSNEDGI